VTRLRVAFLGTAELACASLKALHDSAEYEVVSVITQPDRPKGRSLQPNPSPVKTLAQQLGLPILQPEKARDPALQQQLATLDLTLAVVVAYGQILPPALLDLPAKGCVNVHASLLPRHRGAAPIQWAILEGDPLTGVTIMKLDAGLDTGPILAQRTTPIEAADTAVSLHHRLAQLGAQLLLEILPLYLQGRIQPQPQPSEGASYARKISRADGRIDWTAPARAIWNRVRAFTPWPGTFALFPSTPQPRGLKIWRAEVVATPGSPAPGTVLETTAAGIVVACGSGALRIQDLQLEGGRQLSAEAFIAGHPIPPGTRLG
jgi:methionyl-tRNA formyltransferase